MILPAHVVRRALAVLMVGGLLAAALPGAGVASPGPAGWSVAARPVVPRTHDVTVTMLVPRGSTPDYGIDEVRRSAADVAAYYARETDGRLTMRLERVVDWMWLDTDWPCSWTGALLDWAEPRIGWSRAPARHLVAMTPGNGTCPGWANGEFGWEPGAGGRTFQPSASRDFLVHELGHNMSLPHATSTQCSSWDIGTRAGTLPSGCSRDEYGNLLDMMGGSWDLGDSLSSPYLDRLGMLPRVHEPVCGAVRRMTVTAIEGGAGQRTAVSWTDPRNPGIRFWADLRGRVQPAGLQVMRSDLLDPLATTVLERPGDRSWRRQLLAVGERAPLGGGVWVRLDSVSPDGDSGELAVAVPCHADGPVADPSATTVTARASTATVGHGGTVRVTVRVTAADGAITAGLVTVRDEDRVLARAAVTANGTAVLDVPTNRVPVGQRRLSAAYAGDARFGSSVAELPLLVTRATTRTAVSTTPADRRGRSSIASIRATRSPAGSLPQTVRVTLLRANEVVARATVPLVDGRARWALPRLARGPHRVVADLPATPTTYGSRGSDTVRRR